MSMDEGGGGQRHPGALSGITGDYTPALDGAGPAECFQFFQVPGLFSTVHELDLERHGSFACVGDDINLMLGGRVSPVRKCDALFVVAFEDVFLLSPPAW
ncbi:hypothetical protein [Pelodictyon luteolum]|uniref:hypothetical protein n=1 Tax=Pelodictyon luteolum TaxID=1100 RepID=UPI0012FF2A6E|nr:hypothetical protein [Pelodictyon luteolum]